MSLRPLWKGKPMAIAQNTLSPAIWNTLVRALARGEITQASLVSQVQNNDLITAGPVSAKFEKQGTGAFLVSLYMDGNQQGQTGATSPVEAKLYVLEWLGSQTKRVLEQEKQANTQPA
jgi:hypothetical protein